MITKREDYGLFDPTGHRIFICDKACQTTEIIKWSLLLALFGLFFLWLTIGYWHARRRIRKGLQPMRYHRWLAPKQKLPQNAYAYYNPQQGSYGMQPFPEPPPVYSQDGMPPVYQPPPGGSKVSPQQNGVIHS